MFGNSDVKMSYWHGGTTEEGNCRYTFFRCPTVTGTVSTNEHESTEKKLTISLVSTKIEI